MNACRMCGHQIAPSARACPNCGASDPNIGDFRLKAVAVAILCFVVAALFFFLATANTGAWKIGLFSVALIFAGSTVLGLYHSVIGKDV